MLRRPLLTLPFLVTLLAAGCAAPGESDYPTPVVRTTTAPDAAQHLPHKVLVVAMHTRPDLRNPFEDTFTHDLQSRGLDAVAAHTVIPDPQQVTRERLKQIARRAGCDGILIAGVVKRENVDVMDPGITVGDRGEFRPGYPALSYESYDQPPSTTVEHEVVIETKLFDARTNDLLWAARTETMVMADPAPQLPELTGALTERMQQDGIIPARTATPA